VYDIISLVIPNELRTRHDDPRDHEWRRRRRRRRRRSAAS